MKPRDCQIFKKCGGCDFRLAYSKGQAKKKQEYIERLFKEYNVTPMVTMKNPYHYRNKVLRTYKPMGKNKFVSGIYEKGSHWIIPVKDCLIEDNKSQEIHKTIYRMVKERGISTFNEDTGEGYLRHILIRAAKVTGEYNVTIVVRDKNFPELKEFIKELTKRHSEVKNIYLNPHSRKTSVVVEGPLIQVYGKGSINDKLLGLQIILSGNSFYQVNRDQTEKLYQLVMDLLEPKAGEEILDAYCGIGIMALLAATHGAKSIGVELNESAIKDANEMKVVNNISNAEFIRGDATEYIVNLAEKGKKLDGVIMDPPRSGTTQEFIEALLSLEPEKIVYVSCNPQQLKLELPSFQSKYRVGTIHPVDMFPFTKHVETVVL
ncbi:MAG: 23S rRNA (uracil(1939)-C(5))-methyltransferase RlmD, partial [Tissierellia bacterium]|nr:23S rRNA (uracil(1939)-C(5))-methyltransferase RlmD [Tissierellia bacterium]